MITVREIKEAVAADFGITLEAINGPSRLRKFARPRQIAMFMARELTDYSLPRIGREFGGRDHTTIIHGVREIGNRLEWDDRTRTAVSGLRCKFSGQDQLSPEGRKINAVEGSARLRDAMLALAA